LAEDPINSKHIAGGCALDVIVSLSYFDFGKSIYAAAELRKKSRKLLLKNGVSAERKVKESQ
jgi:hypothetical protein